MGKSKTGKRLMNMVYGIGASVVILGALFKILHWPFGNEMLMIGLITEAFIFFISAFESIDEEYDWSIVYPELAGAAPSSKKEKVAIKDEKQMLSQKLDDLLKEARIDANLMESLGRSIRNFEGAAKGISSTTDSIAAHKKYSEEMGLAATQMESLNSLYKTQLQSQEQQTKANQAMAQNATMLKEQMESLASNLSSLNGVYGGMLSAMNRK